LLALVIHFGDTLTDPFPIPRRFLTFSSLNLAVAGEFHFAAADEVGRRMFKEKNTCDCVVDVADQIDRLHLDGGECVSARGPFTIFSSGGSAFS
jgi:hypothetical protein